MSHLGLIKCKFFFVFGYIIQKSKVCFSFSWMYYLSNSGLQVPAKFPSGRSTIFWIASPYCESMCCLDLDSNVSITKVLSQVKVYRRFRAINQFQTTSLARLKFDFRVEKKGYIIALAGSNTFLRQFFFCEKRRWIYMVVVFLFIYLL